MIRAQRLCKFFGNVRALNGIDVQIDVGQPTGLVGPNGAGKTTLFSVLCGFLRPTEGEVTIDGHPPLARPLHGRIAILPQDAVLTPTVKISEQLSFMAELQGMTRSAAKAEAARVLDIVGLGNKANQAPDALSHGMKKRAAIAQCFLGEPDLVLLDEPTSGLDPNTAGVIKELIRQTGDQRKFVISSHNLADIEDLCGDVVILKSGQVSKHEKIDTLVARTTALTVSLAASAPAGIEEKLSAIEGVSAAEAIGEDRIQLRVLFDSGKETEVQVAVLQTLKTNGVDFRELSRGESLESKVREISS